MSKGRWIVMWVGALSLSLALSGEAGAEGDAAELFQRSYDTEAEGKTQEALAAMERLPSPQRDQYVALYRRGWLLYKLGRNAESIDAYTKASLAEPRAVESRVAVLLPQMALRRWGDVEVWAKDALRVDPQSYLASLRLAFALYNLGRYAESAPIYQRLADAYPSDVEVRSGLGWALFKLGKLGDAAKAFRQVVDVAPKHALAREGLKACGVTH